MSDPREIVKLTEAESAERPMTNAEVMALKLHWPYEERKYIDSLSRNRGIVSENKDVASECMPCAHPKQSKTYNDFFHVYMGAAGILITLFAFLAPKKSFSGTTRQDAFIDTVWLLLIAPTVIVFMYWAFRPLINAISRFIGDVAKFFYKAMIQALKLLIRGICGIPNALKQIEKWSRER